MKDKKIAVILFSLGGPLKREDIKPFLFKFFMDKNIIMAPLPIRYLLAKYISIKRGGGAALESYNRMGGKSPLLENTIVQAQALQTLLSNEQDAEYKVFVAMRYWHPLTENVAKEVETYNPDEVIMLPLYPQYSTTTTKSSFEEWYKYYPHKNKCREINSYYDNNKFIKASAQLIAKTIGEIKNGYRLLFSAHGLPVSIIKAGDPYQKQCKMTAAKIAAELKIENLDWQICYQSRVGPMEWIKPSIAEALQQAANDGKGVIVYPLAFVSEHVETLVELDIEYKEEATKLGLNFYKRVPTVSIEPLFIEALRDLVTGKK